MPRLSTKLLLDSLSPAAPPLVFGCMGPNCGLFLNIPAFWRRRLWKWFNSNRTYYAAQMTPTTFCVDSPRCGGRLAVLRHSDDIIDPKPMEADQARRLDLAFKVFLRDWRKGEWLQHRF